MHICAAFSSLNYICSNSLWISPWQEEGTSGHPSTSTWGTQTWGKSSPRKLCWAGKTSSISAKLFLDHKIRENRARRVLKSSARSPPYPGAESATWGSLPSCYKFMERLNYPNAILTSKALSLCCRLQGKLCSIWASHFSIKSLLTHSNRCCWHHNTVWDLITQHPFTFYLQSTSWTSTN